MQHPHLELLFASLVVCACNAKVTTPSGLVGKHAVDGTYVVNSFQAAGPPAGMQAPHRYRPILTVTALSESEFRIINEKDGLSFTARLRDDELYAEQAVVTISPNGSASAANWQSMTLPSFRWSFATGALQFTDNRVVDVPGGGPAHGFVDARVDGAADSVQRWVHYGATTNFPWDFQHGAECLLGGEDTAEGFLGLSYGTTKNELKVYLQGIGCSISAQSTDGNRFSAAGADCPLDPVMSIAHLGIQSWLFETFSLDRAAKQLSFLARATRTRGDGTLVDLCLKLDSAVDGDFPP